MGYPNPHESPYDLFMTGHAGCSVSTVLGLKSGDDLIDGTGERHAVAVIGDGAFPSGIVYEAMNNAGPLGKKILVVLNDNQMSICPRVGGLADYLDRLRINSRYRGLKSEVQKILNRVPLLGEPTERFLLQVKEAVKAGLHGGMLFEVLGFRYIGPVDGHNLPQLCKYLRMVKDLPGPVLLHVVTEKGHGFKPAAEDPVSFHTPAPFTCDDAEVISFNKSSGRAYTDVASAAVHEAMKADARVTVLTAAMCQGTKLEAVREAFPDRFFDTGICESHTVAFAAGHAKAGLRPIVDIYSTFLQRSYDQVFQEVALQNLPVTFLMDRAGITGPDGPTHHGMFDIGYMRVFPNMVVMAPGDENDLSAMLDFSLRHDGPTTIRYPKATSRGSARLGRGWRDHRLWYAAFGVRRSGAAAGRPGARHRRDQRAVHQAARRAGHLAGNHRVPSGRHGRRGSTRRRLRQCGSRGRQQRRVVDRARAAAGHSRSLYRARGARGTLGRARSRRPRHRGGMRGGGTQAAPDSRGAAARQLSCRWQLVLTTPSGCGSTPSGRQA